MTKAEAIERIENLFLLTEESQRNAEDDFVELGTLESSICEIVQQIEVAGED